MLFVYQFSISFWFNKLKKNNLHVSWKVSYKFWIMDFQNQCFRYLYFYLVILLKYHSQYTHIVSCKAWKHCNKAKQIETITHLSWQFSDTKYPAKHNIVLTVLWSLHSYSFTKKMTTYIMVITQESSKIAFTLFKI